MADAHAEQELIDLEHLGRAHVIGAYRVGEVIVDPGPSSCLPRLLDALGGRQPRAVALTHIHLDHAGAAGSLAARFPQLEVWVHERGAEHLIDPSRLLRSATRLYGSDMERLWGEVLPVPADRIRVLTGGEDIDGFRVAYTPGHASHHVCYLHAASGTAFTGDVAGVRIDGGPALPPTPPPDIDLRAWRSSLDTVRAWKARALAVTHFGRYEDVEAQLEAMCEELSRAAELAQGLDERGFVDAVRARVADAASGQTAAAYEQATPPALSYAGLRRWIDRAGETTRSSA